MSRVTAILSLVAVAAVLGFLVGSTRTSVERIVRTHVHTQTLAITVDRILSVTTATDPTTGLTSPVTTTTQSTTSTLSP